MREKLWRGMPVSVWTEVQNQNKAMFQPRGKTAMGPGKVSADVYILLYTASNDKRSCLQQVCNWNGG